MNHVKILYYLIGFLTCVFALGCGIIIYLKSKNKIVKAYLNFLILLVILSFTWVIFAYHRILYPEIREVIFMIRVILENFTVISLKWVFPFFIHTFLDIPFAKIANRVCLGIAWLSATYFIPFHFFHHTLYEMMPGSSLLDNNYYYLSGIIVAVIFLYCFILCCIYYKKLKNEIQKSLCRMMLIIVLLSIPLILFDNLTPVTYHFAISTPLIVIIVNIVSFYFAIKYFFLAPASQEKAVTLVPGDTFFETYNISSREKEICLLLLEGHSYEEIGEIAFISKATVKTHINKIYRKTDVKKRKELLKLIEPYYVPLDEE